MTGTPQIEFGTVGEGQTRSADLEIKHSHGDKVELKIEPRQKYAGNFELRKMEKDKFRLFFTPDEQMPQNTILSDHLVLIDLVNQEKMKLPFGVKIA